jgi:hypothetical protein
MDKPHIKSLNARSDALQRYQHIWLLAHRFRDSKYVLPSDSAELSATSTSSEDRNRSSLQNVVFSAD